MSDTRTWTGTTDGSFTTATNWSDDTAPITGDTAIVPKNATVDIDADLTNSTVDLAVFYVEDDCTIDIGTATQPLEIGLAASGVMDLAGTGTISLEVAGDLSTNTITVRACGTLYLAGNGGEELCDNLYITATSGDIYITWGNAQLAEIDNIYAIGGANLYIGDSVTKTGGGAITSITAAAGTIKCRSAVALVTSRGASYYQEAGAVALMHVYDGTTYYNGSGTLTTGHVYSDGEIDFTGNTYGVTVTTLNVYGSATVNDAYNAVAVGTIINFNGTSADTANVNFGTGRKITTGSI